MLLLINIFLGIIIVLLVLLILVLAKFSGHVQVSVQKVQADLDRVSIEASHLASSLNEFIKSDVRKISGETSGLISKLTDIASDVNDKSRSLNCLFKPLGLLSSKMNLDSSSDESSKPCTSIPKILDWITTAIFIIKKTKEIGRKL